MGDEDAFQQQLDAHPDDHLTRLVLADWLEEQGDDRAIGYRAMGELRLMPHISRYTKTTWAWYWTCWEEYLKERNRCYCDLNTDWYALLPRKSRWRCTPYTTRRDAEDAAARAFARLPPERRAQLLQQEVLA